MKPFLLIIALILLSGCTLTTYRGAQGESFTRVSIGAAQSVGEVAYKNGDRSLVIKQAGSDQTEVAGKVVEAIK